MKLAFVQAFQGNTQNVKDITINNAEILRDSGIEYIVYDTTPNDEILKIARELQTLNKDLVYVKKKFVSKKKSFINACILSNADYFLILETTDLIDLNFLETVNHDSRGQKNPQRVLFDKKTLKHFAENFHFDNFKNEKLLLWLKPNKTFLEKVRLRYFW